MKQLAAMLALVVCLSFVPSTISAQSPAWQPVRTTTGDSFQVPSSWVPASSSTSARELLITGEGAAAYNIDQHGIYDAERAVRVAVTETPAGWADAHVVFVTPITVAGGTSAYQAISTVTDDKGIGQNLFAEAVSGPDGIHTLIVLASDSYSQQNMTTITGILQSFQIMALAAPAAPAAVPLLNQSAVATEPVGALLLQASGNGNSNTTTFQATGGRLQLCWSVFGQASSGAFGPQAYFNVEPAGHGSYRDFFSASSVEQKCSYLYPDSGTYYVSVIATDWTHWSVTVVAA